MQNVQQIPVNSVEAVPSNVQNNMNNIQSVQQNALHQSVQSLRNPGLAHSVAASSVSANVHPVQPVNIMPVKTTAQPLQTSFISATGQAIGSTPVQPHFQTTQHKSPCVPVESQTSGQKFYKIVENDGTVTILSPSLPEQSASEIKSVVGRVASDVLQEVSNVADSPKTTVRSPVSNGHIDIEK